MSETEIRWRDGTVGRKKIKIDLPPYKAPVEAPPRECVVCETTKRSFVFHGDFGRVCGNCTRPNRVPLMPGTNVQDWLQLSDAYAVIRALGNHRASH